MLSKLRYFSCKQGSTLPDFRASINRALVLRHFKEAALKIRSVDSGTLGAGFLLEVDGRRRFLKTHAVQEGWNTLNKEGAILSCLYQERIHLDRIEIDDAGTFHLCLIMDELVYPPVEFDIGQVFDLIEAYSEQLKYCPGVLHIPVDDNFACLLREGNEALQNLVRNGLLSEVVRDQVQSRLSLLEQQVDRFPPHVCHGDLGPKNLMSDGQNPIVIDWEDAFWGIEGYDYLYWLTFFSNRKYYSQHIFGRTPWGKETEIAIIILILLLKSELSFRTSSYKENKITFDQRILEILRLA